MTVTVNGQPREVPEGSTVRELLEALGLGKAACAVEVNQSLVPKARHASTPLSGGDRVEVVTLVGGG